jgi:intracellular septation protein A
MQVSLLSLHDECDAIQHIAQITSEWHGTAWKHSAMSRIQNMVNGQLTSHALDHVFITLKVPTPLAGRYVYAQGAETFCVTANISDWRRTIVRLSKLDETIELRNEIWRTLNTHYDFFFPIETNTLENPMRIEGATYWVCPTTSHEHSLLPQHPA